jgi:hypothetical protein
MKTETSTESWASAWPDALAFSVGLAAAWWAGWKTGDLVWSLWLASLVVGYSIIVWTLVRPALEVAYKAWRESEALGLPRPTLPVWILLAVVGLLLLGFFTVHFGFFHYIHSQLLVAFFPIYTGGARPFNGDSASMYGEIVRRYWSFLPAAFLAERAAFKRTPPTVKRDASLVAAAGVRAGKGGQIETLIAGPYKNVVRLHTLIFFFFFAHFAKLDNFAVYAVVYAVYFFPWRLVRRSPVEPAPA